MPAYEVEHICPLTEAQKDELAEAITKIHSEQFSTPKIFVNIRFTNVENHCTYVAGKRVRSLLLLHDHCVLWHAACQKKAHTSLSEQNAYV